MEQVKEFFNDLTTTSLWPARWHCGYWSDFHGWLYIVSDLLIWLAYFLIPVIILRYILRKKATLRYHKAYVYFAAFILLCGLTHLVDAVMFWYPMYKVNTLIRFATAIVSLATVYYLIQILPEAFKGKTHQELEKEIALRQAAEEQLHNANAGLEAFAYMASHDMQEPLRKITSFAGMLQDRNEGKLDEQSIGLLEKINRSAGRLQVLINDSLSLATLDNNVQMQKVELDIAIESALETLEIKILEKNAKISVQKLPAVMGNENYLVQVFTNIINNALKFSKEIPFISISAVKKDDLVELSIADNGIGMDEKDLEKIFTAFQRLHSKSQYEGTGIGLAICKQIVEIHKGNITVESEPGKGTTFRISLPAA